MKIEGGSTKGFSPFSIEITFETLEEAEAFHNIFNHTNILQAVGLEHTASDIREMMESYYPELEMGQSWGEFAERLKTSMRR